MKYHTIKEIEKIVSRTNLGIVELWQENKWVVVLLSSGTRIKFRNF